jgi:hypothetical protein
VFAAALLVSSCSLQDTKSNVSTTNAVVETTLPAKAANPMLALSDLAQRVKAVDYSRLSINHDGIFAVILRDKRYGAVASVGTFTLWRWDGTMWNDVSTSIVDQPLGLEFFEPRSNYGATIVTSYDYNEDGVVDFLVEFNEKDLGLNHSAGGILSNRGGFWHWESFIYLDGSSGKAADSLSYNPKTHELTIRDYPSDRFGYQADAVTVYWDAPREVFVADPNTYSYVD